MTYETILVDRQDRVATITLNRPDALNALNGQVMIEVTTAAAELDDDPGVGAIILSGSAKAFAAGADIKEMASLSFGDVFSADYFAAWDKFAAVRTPTIAAVAGYALGGGCELAMMCDVLIAADTAKFGQPEIKLGVLPGMGGSQRLTRAIGKAKAMDMILTGRNMDAAEAERSGLVSRVVPADELQREARRWRPPSRRCRCRRLGWPRRRSTAHSNRPCRKDFCTSAGCSIPRSRPRIRARAWPRLSRNAPRTSLTANDRAHDRDESSKRSPGSEPQKQAEEPAAEKPDWWQRRYTFTGTRSGWCSCGCR